MEILTFHQRIKNHKAETSMMGGQRGIVVAKLSRYRVSINHVIELKVS